MKRIAFFLIPLFAVTLLCACKKNNDTNSSGGTTVQGNVTLTIAVRHHSWGVPSIPVYLKFNTTDWPGKDTTKYDIRQVANLEGVITFNHIGPGNLVIYSAGYDSIYGAYVIGYGSINIAMADAGNTVNDTVIVSEKF